VIGQSMKIGARDCDCDADCIECFFRLLCSKQDWCPLTKINLNRRVRGAEGHEAAGAKDGTDKRQICTPQIRIDRTDADNFPFQVLKETDE
jgi:hypothetical protein